MQFGQRDASARITVFLMGMPGCGRAQRQRGKGCSNVERGSSVCSAGEGTAVVRRMPGRAKIGRLS